MGTQHTRERLMAAGERLMGEHGIDGVSLRQIAAEAGERNTGVVQYHFGGRDGLVTAIMRWRMGEVDARRQELLDAFAAAGRGDDLHAALEAAVLPLARYVLENDAARMAYNLFLAQVHHRYQHFAVDAIASMQVEGLRRVFTIVRGHMMHLPSAVFFERRAQLISYVIHALADRARLLRSNPQAAREMDARVFVHTLIDTAVGLVTAPVSAQTEASLEAAGHAAGD